MCEGTVLVIELLKKIAIVYEYKTIEVITQPPSSSASYSSFSLPLVLFPVVLVNDDDAAAAAAAAAVAPCPWRREVVVA